MTPEKKLNCWEFFKCSTDKECVIRNSKFGRTCWLVDTSKKLAKCKKCAFFLGILAGNI